jgi:DHA1 family tetracycline resistance protein-like MFS transporter
LFSSTLAYLGWGLATEGWMMFAIILMNLLSVAVNPAIQSLISSAVPADQQGQTLGAVAGLQSLTMVLAPVLGAGLLGLVSELPKGDWRIGMPFFFCSALQATSLALAWWHFRTHARHLARVTGG